MIIHLISGFKGIGKDSFLQNPENFRIYSNGLDVVPLRGRRLAFADEVKRELKIPENLTREEKEKIRPSIVKFAQDKKLEDPFYWVKKVAFQFDDAEEVVITDWRFVEELEFLRQNKKQKILTYRIISEKIILPDINDLTERALDYYPFDFLVRWNNAGIK